VKRTRAEAKESLSAKSSTSGGGGKGTPGWHGRQEGFAHRKFGLQPEPEHRGDHRKNEGVCGSVKIRTQAPPKNRKDARTERGANNQSKKKKLWGRSRRKAKIPDQYARQSTEIVASSHDKKEGKRGNPRRRGKKPQYWEKRKGVKKKNLNAVPRKKRVTKKIG